MMPAKAMVRHSVMDGFDNYRVFVQGYCSCVGKAKSKMLACHSHMLGFAVVMLMLMSRTFVFGAILMMANVLLDFSK